MDNVAREIGEAFVEALEEVQEPPHYFNEDCNEYLKTRKGLQMMLTDYPSNVPTPIEFAIWQEHIMWGYPYCD